MNLRSFERSVIYGTRYLTLLSVVGTLAGAALMFLLGLYNIYEAFWSGLQDEEAAPFGTAAVISVIEGLDRFLIAIVLLYFSYGVYSLFIHPEEPEEKLAIPAWLRVKQIGQLKQVVAEVIIVVLFVLFLRVALQTFRSATLDLGWQQILAFALLPTSVLMLSLSLRFVELHPKPTRSPTAADEADGSGRRDGQSE